MCNWFSLQRYIVLNFDQDLLTRAVGVLFIDAVSLKSFYPARSFFHISLREMWGAQHQDCLRRRTGFQTSVDR